MLLSTMHWRRCPHHVCVEAGLEWDGVQAALAYGPDGGGGGGCEG